MTEKVSAPGMTSTATQADAEIILRLYDLRREPVMREARKFMAFDFWPSSFEDLGKLFAAAGKEFAYFRQVTSYWDMAASFVMRGALNEDLFFDSGAEMWFTLAKVYPFLKEVRDKALTPTYLARVEKLATRTKNGRDRLETMVKRVEARRAASAKAA